MLEHLISESAQTEAQTAYQVYRREQFDCYSRQVAKFVAEAEILTIGPRLLRPARNLEVLTMYGRRQSALGKTQEATFSLIKSSGDTVGIGYSSITPNINFGGNIACGAMATTIPGIASTAHVARELTLGTLAQDKSQLLNPGSRITIQVENMNFEASQQFLLRASTHLTAEGYRALANLISLENYRWHKLFGEDGYFGYDGGGRKACKAAPEGLGWQPTTVIIEEDGSLAFSDYDQFEITAATLAAFAVPARS
jgi:hypothetical protein